MRSAGRGFALLIVVLTVLLTGLGPAAARSERAGPPADPVVVVGLPAPLCGDVTPVGTPELWALAEHAAIGSLSVRAARSTTCVLDGWATLGAGNRARVPGPGEGLPPGALPTVPLPEDPAADPTTPPEDGPAPQPPLDTSLSYCGLQERAAGVALARSEE